MLRNIAELTPEEVFVLAIHSRRKRPPVEVRAEYEEIKKAWRARRAELEDESCGG
jgi:hypothetical protein